MTMFGDYKEKTQVGVSQIFCVPGSDLIMSLNTGLQADRMTRWAWKVRPLLTSEQSKKSLSVLRSL